MRSRNCSYISGLLPAARSPPYSSSISWVSVTLLMLTPFRSGHGVIVLHMQLVVVRIALLLLFALAAAALTSWLAGAEFSLALTPQLAALYFIPANIINLWLLRRGPEGRPRSLLQLMNFDQSLLGRDVLLGLFYQLVLFVPFGLAINLAASVLQFLQGWLLNDAVQRTVYRMRSLVEDKLHRLPLSYFDHQPRGELLSRVTNDIDNVQQSLQQTLTQLLNALLQVIFILVMMFLISPVLSLVALLSIPVTMVVAGLIMSRSRVQFMEQWRSTGTLNSRVEEAFTGHDLVKVFGRQKEVQEQFEVENEQLFQSSFRAQFLSGLIMPVSMFIGNLNYAVIAVMGGLRVANGTISLGEVQAFIQYSRQDRKSTRLNPSHVAIS